MKIISASFNEMYNENPQKHIEEIARTCYKSNELITDNSHKKFIKSLYDKKHWAMLEHFIFIYRVIGPTMCVFEDEKYICSTRRALSTTEYVNGPIVRNIISFSARSLLDMLVIYKDNDYKKSLIIELIEQVVNDYDCDELFGNMFKKVDHIGVYSKIDDVTMLTPEEQWVHGWKSIKFICDRGVSHEIVRHRDSSYAQESTRYCNYSKDKFGNEIIVVKPCMFNNDSEDINEKQKYKFWEESIKHSEDAYFYLLDMGATPQEARSVLPNSLKTEIIMTAHNYEWGHFFELRCDKTAHPQMREIAVPLFNYFNDDNDVLFNRETIKFND